MSWPERQRRYALQGEVARLRSRLEEEQSELDSLGAILFNPVIGQVGFPTIMYDRPAYYSWQLGEDNLSFWHFDGESTRRPLPPSGQDSSTRLVTQR